ncbi:MAG: hypothetical protein V3S44_00945 [Alphaproteobacteria bacterium]
MTRRSKRIDNPRGALIGILGALVPVLTVIFLMAPEASAQQATCQARAGLATLLEERYAEKPVAAGLEAGGRLIELFASADSTSWTMVTTTPAGESCVMAIGEHWLEMKRPANDGPQV